MFAVVLFSIGLLAYPAGWGSGRVKDICGEDNDYLSIYLLLYLAPTGALGVTIFVCPFLIFWTQYQSVSVLLKEF